MTSRTDRALLILTALFVAGLAFVAGTISFAHMRELATHHGQLGWKSYAFPISVDGLEIVASLYLVVQRRAGRPTGWLPWVALIVGTAASLAANVAVGGADPIAKALAGWPAVSMLVSIKLLFSMINHTAVERPDGQDDQRTVRDSPDIRDTVLASSAISPAGSDRAGRRTPPGDDLADLIPAARAACTTLAINGRTLSRDNLADALRDEGNSVSNERVSRLLRMLKGEQGGTATGPEEPESRSK
ncbi:DUF2637 domain-containing protein [Actinoplanes sp. NBC_00393]|uniref:DUF2637 domain-containing protein n=1 Tax=Actinoplanes sp. NBC_00393 TaxID=2975953 RepID=UPI002E1CE5AE